MEHAREGYISGDVDYGSHQASTLTADEKRSGFALFCCARPLTDLVIEVREVRRAGDIQIKRLPCRIESIEKAAPDVAIVRFKLPANERLQYLAGQYVDFLLKDGKRRSFSLATAPHDDSLLELHIRHVPNGFFTDLLCSRNTRGARFCGSKARWVRSTSVKSPTSR